jgi:hypothetical protein
MSRGDCLTVQHRNCRLPHPRQCCRGRHIGQPSRCPQNLLRWRPQLRSVSPSTPWERYSAGIRTECIPLVGRTNHKWQSSWQASSAWRCTESFPNHSSALGYIILPQNKHTAEQTGGAVTTTVENNKQNKTNSVVLVHERTIQTQRPLLVGKVSANFWV